MQNTLNVLVVDHAEDEMQFPITHLCQLAHHFRDAGHIVPRVGDGERVLAKDLLTAHQMGITNDLGDTVADVVFREVEFVAQQV